MPSVKVIRPLLSQLAATVAQGYTAVQEPNQGKSSYTQQTVAMAQVVETDLVSEVFVP